MKNIQLGKKKSCTKATQISYTTTRFGAQEPENISLKT
jgi:hypothetical protein